MSESSTWEYLYDETPYQTYTSGVITSLYFYWGKRESMWSITQKN